MSHSSGDDNDELFNTQENKDVYTTIHERYAHLGKVDFCNELSTDHDEHDLGVYRQALYDYSLKHVPDTPRGQLVNRKNTSGKSKGASLALKLSEDIYSITRYIDGDKCVDICKLFPERARTRIRNKDQSAVHEDSVPLDNMSDVQDKEVPVTQALVKLCQDFMSGMRIFQETIQADVRDIKSDTALIREMRLDLSNIKRDIERIDKTYVNMEKRVQNQQVQLDRNKDRFTKLEHENKSLRELIEERTRSLRHDIVGINQQLNVMNLSSASKSFNHTLR